VADIKGKYNADYNTRFIYEYNKISVNVLL